MNSIKSYGFFLFTLITIKICHSQDDLRGPPLIEPTVNLLDSYIPPAMQIIAHLTENLKYDLRPDGSPSTTTIMPTSTHKPGIYAPGNPLGPEQYFLKGISYRDYVQKLISGDYSNYFDRYKVPVEAARSQDVEHKKSPPASGDLPEDLENLIGDAPAYILKLVNREENEVSPKIVESQIQQFSQSYDDSNFRFYLAKATREPPITAYVQLLSLYDLLNKDSKKLGLNKYQGYTQNILIELAETSSGTSALQLKTVLTKIRTNQDTKTAEVLRKIGTVLQDLDKDTSYLSTALRHIPPLQFSL